MLLHVLQAIRQPTVQPVRRATHRIPMSRSFVALLALTLLALITACGSRNASADIPPAATASHTAVTVLQPAATATVVQPATSTRAPQPTFTPLPTATATDTPTVAPTATATDTPTVTPTATTTDPPTVTPPPVPPLATATPTPNQQGEIVHQVQPGETIYTIATQYGVLWSQLTAHNQISPNDVKPGTTVRIPVGMMEQRYSGAGHDVATPLPGSVSQDRVVLSGMTHDWQKLNNCGPTSASVLLSYYGINHSQLTIAAALKPLGGADKNVSPAEIAAYARGVGLAAFVGINANIEMAERLLSAGFPFLAEQWLEYDGGVGHYRVVRGFDRTAREMLYNDTFLGPDIWKSYDQFLRDWSAYNNTYVVFYPPELEAQVRQAIGPDWDPNVMWERLRAESQARLDQGERGGYLWYGLGEALHHLGRDAEAVRAYEQAIAAGLPWRYLWYRYGYFEALNNTGQYEKTLQATQPILNAMAASEDLRYHRGVALRSLGRIEEARAEFQAALRDNANFAPAQVALAQLSSPAPAPGVEPAVPAEGGAAAEPPPSDQNG